MTNVLELVKNGEQTPVTALSKALTAINEFANLCSDGDDAKTNHALLILGVNSMVSLMAQHVGFSFERFKAQIEIEAQMREAENSAAILIALVERGRV